MINIILIFNRIFFLIPQRNLNHVHYKFVVGEAPHLRGEAYLFSGLN